MTRVNYTGILDPKGEVEKLRPAADQLISMMLRCKPFGPDYCILLGARHSLETVAFHFTRDPSLFGSKPPSG